MKNGISTILFDMGGTLRGTKKRSKEDRLHYTREILVILNAEDDPGDFSAMLARRLAAYRKWARETMIELNEADLWIRWMLPDWPQDLVRSNAVKLNLLWREATGERIVFPETAEVIKELFRRGYRLGLVSNTTSSVEAPDALKKLRLTGYFETMVLSAVVGKRKPDPRILLDATTTMGVDPAECAYVGDIPERDVAAARLAGFKLAVLINNPEAGRKTRRSVEGLEPDHWITNLKDLFPFFPPRPAPKPSFHYDASLSSMWGIGNFQSLEDFLEAARRLGFRYAELNHQVDSSMLEGIGKLRNKISSVHEPCPADISAAEYKNRDWLISSTNEEYRVEGVRSIKRSLDLAHEIKAKYIVVHAGNVQQDHSLEDRLRRMFDRGETAMQAYADIKKELVEKRRRQESARFQALKRSIQELLDYAKPLGVKLGLENRSHILEIPVPEELEELLAMAEPARIGFIFDVGHAGALDRLGFYPTDTWLKRFGERIIGVHIHDMDGLDDHIAPGAGDMNYRELSMYIPKEACKVIEAQNHNSYQQIRTGLVVLNQSGCIKKM